ncbi:hypothetical protein [Stackebrandtia soli]|uniref:hypothetical protein n=1 Tax=Stackebrandtia soli TaxID=1892856 RepID=UPI0039E855C8
MTNEMIMLDPGVCSRLDKLAKDEGCDRQAMIVKLMDDFEESEAMDEAEGWATLDPFD